MPTFVDDLIPPHHASIHDAPPATTSFTRPVLHLHEVGTRYLRSNLETTWLGHGPAHTAPVWLKIVFGTLMYEPQPLHCVFGYS